MAFDNNTRAVLATLNTGIGESHLGNVLSTLNIPPLSRSTFKRRERETSKAVEKVVRQSCYDATHTERLHALESGSAEDTDGLVDITCSRAFNSSTGHGAVMSLSLEKCWHMQPEIKNSVLVNTVRANQNFQS